MCILGDIGLVGSEYGGNLPNDLRFHSLVPVRVTENPNNADNRYYEVTVYDPLYPGQERPLYISKSKTAWEYTIAGNVVWRGDKLDPSRRSRITYVPTSYMGNTVEGLPNNPVTLSQATGIAAPDDNILLFTNDYSVLIKNSNNIVARDIPNAYEVYPMGVTLDDLESGEYASYPLCYKLPDDKYSLNFSDNIELTADVSFANQKTYINAKGFDNHTKVGAGVDSGDLFIRFESEYLQENPLDIEVLHAGYNARIGIEGAYTGVLLVEDSREGVYLNGAATVSVSYRGQTKNIKVSPVNTIRITINNEDQVEIWMYDPELDTYVPYVFGVSLVGRVKTYNPKNPTTITLKRNGKEIFQTIEPASGSGQIEQSFVFEDIEPGTYTLEITKPVHTKFTVLNVVVGEDGLDLTKNERTEIQLMTLLCGDINGNGAINSADLNILWSSANYLKSVNDPGVNKLADLNGDGVINSADLNILWSSANYLKGDVIYTLDSPNMADYFVDPVSVTFPSVVVGYGTQPVQQIAISNTGTAELSSVGASITAGDLYFEITSTPSDTISGGSLDYVSVRPLMELAVGTYTGILTIMTGDAGSKTIPLIFTVVSIPTPMTVDIAEEFDVMQTYIGGDYSTYSSTFFSLDATGSRTSGPALKIEAQRSTECGFIYTVKLKPNTAYIVEAGLKGQNIVADGEVGANISYYGGCTASNLNLVGTFNWTTVKYVVCTDAHGYLKVDFRLGFWWNIARGTMWVDNIMIDEYEPELWRSSGNVILTYPHELIYDGSTRRVTDAQLNTLAQYFGDYEAELAGLFGGRPFGGDKVVIDGANILVVTYAAAVAGNPIALSTDEMRRTIDSLISDPGYYPWGVLHEISHNFDNVVLNGHNNQRFNWAPESTANFKIIYGLEQLMANVKLLGVRYGFNSGTNGSTVENYFAEQYFSSGLGANTPQCTQDSLTHIMISIKNRIGWTPFKQAYSYIVNLPDAQVPTTALDKLTLFLDKLSEYSGENVYNFMPDSASNAKNWAAIQAELNNNSVISRSPENGSSPEFSMPPMDQFHFDYESAWYR